MLQRGGERALQGGGGERGDARGFCRRGTALHAFVHVLVRAGVFVRAGLCWLVEASAANRHEKSPAEALHLKGEQADWGKGAQADAALASCAREALWKAH